MLRVAFYDGSGFDYMASLLDANRKGDFLLVLLFMCVSAMIILNGLIGVFGLAFNEEDTDDNTTPENSYVVKSAPNVIKSETNANNTKYLKQLIKNNLPDNIEAEIEVRSAITALRWWSGTAVIKLKRGGSRSIEPHTRHMIFYIYIIVSSLLALLENILVAFPDSTFTAQVVVLGMSSLFFLLQYIGVVWAMKDNSILTRIVLYSKEPEVMLELVCFILGWSLLFRIPAMASLRIVRVFSVLWYAKLYSSRNKNHGNSSLKRMIANTCITSVKYLEKVGEELFTLKTKGGVVVLAILFYLAYVVGNAYFIQTQYMTLISSEGGTTDMSSINVNDTTAYPINAGHSQCDSNVHCWFTMIRLTMYDGSGLDFLKSLLDNQQPGLAFFLFIYVILTAMVLLNGLTGIFAKSFEVPVSSDDLPTNLPIDQLQNLAMSLTGLDVLVIKREEYESLKRSPPGHNLVQSNDYLDVQQKNGFRGIQNGNQSHTPPTNYGNDADRLRGVASTLSPTNVDVERRRHNTAFEKQLDGQRNSHNSDTYILRDEMPGNSELSSHLPDYLSPTTTSF